MLLSIFGNPTPNIYEKNNALENFAFENTAFVNGDYTYVKVLYFK